MEQISETHGLPSSWDLAYAEARSLPTLYRRGAAEWPALSRWPGLEGAKYLSDLHGDNIVDVAISTDTTFSGDVRHAMSVSVPFRAFLHGDIFCEESDVAGGEGALGRLSEGSNVTSSGNAQPMACYLAQCPIYSKSGHSRELPPEGEQHETTVPVGASSSLHKLMRDVIVPQALGDCGSLCCVNLWMCGSAKGPLTSTLHYDGHNNILTCVSGCKKVLLFPPDHSECLAALQPVYATSCNHCRLRNEAFAAAWSGGLEALLHPGGNFSFLRIDGGVFSWNCARLALTCISCFRLPLHSRGMVSPSNVRAKYHGGQPVVAGSRRAGSRSGRGPGYFLLFCLLHVAALAPAAARAQASGQHRRHHLCRRGREENGRGHSGRRGKATDLPCAAIDGSPRVGRAGASPCARQHGSRQRACQSRAGRSRIRT